MRALCSPRPMADLFANPPIYERGTLARMAALCARCPILDACRDGALAQPDHVGMQAQLLRSRRGTLRLVPAAA